MLKFFVGQNPGGGVGARAEAGGVMAFRKNCQGAPPILSVIAFLLTSFF